MEKIKIDQSIQMLEFGLSHYSELSNSKSEYLVNKIYFSQQSALVVEYITSKTDPIDIKGELGEIISFVGSFYFSETSDELEYEIPMFFAAMALNKEKQKLIYAISSHDATKNIMKGNSIEWLKHTIFEDQTNDFLLSQAKLKIFKLENALRKIIYVKLSNQWCQSIDAKIYKDAFKACKNITGNNDKKNPEILEYTYLPQLKTMIENNWNYFEDVFNDKTGFIQAMNKLNKIRRNESHNRKITKPTLDELNEVHDFLMSCMAKDNPDITPHYIIENWRKSIYKIINNLSLSIPNIEEKDRCCLNKTMSAMRIYSDAVGIAVRDLDELIIPLNKQKLHNKLLKILTGLDSILKNMIKNGEQLAITEVKNDFDKYVTKMKELDKFQEMYLLSEL